MATKKNTPGEFYITELTVQNYQGLLFDISDKWVMIDIFESIYDPTIEFQVVLNDAVGLLETIPFLGEEKIFFTFHTGDQQKSIRRIYNVFKLSDMKDGTGVQTIYRLHCVSPEAMLNTRLRVYSNYSLTRYSDMAQAIYDEYFQRELQNLFSRHYEKEFNVEPSAGQYTIAFPGSRPFEALEMCARRSTTAVDPRNIPGALFFFWETLHGYYFRSLETIMLRAQRLRTEGVLDEIPRYFVRPKNRGGVEEEDFTTVDSFEYSNYFDTLRGMTEGMFTRKFLGHNLFDMTVEETEYLYDRDGLKEAHMNGPSILASSKSMGLAPEGTELKGSKHNKFAHVEYYPVSGSGFSTTFVNKAEHWKPHRGSQMEQLKSLNLEVRIPGDDRVESGTVILLDIKSKIPFDESSTESLRSGAFMVTGIHHQFYGDNYSMKLDLAKDSYEGNLNDVFFKPNPNQQIDPETQVPLSHSEAKTPSTIPTRSKGRGTDDNDTDEKMYKIFSFAKDQGDPVPTGPRTVEVEER
tara:strand:+ start:4599 stop:6161 length:1563 start_codon:yes stop_codon:yes gene_type:complete